jgi:hypothetical protein
MTSINATPTEPLQWLTQPTQPAQLWSLLIPITIGIQFCGISLSSLSPFSVKSKTTWLLLDIVRDR